MIKESERKQYSVGGTYANAVVLLLILCLFRPGIVNAQHTCDEATQRIYRITTTEERQVPDSLQTLLDLVAFVRDCQDGVSLELELWLLNNEVFALDELGRHEEASAEVDRFFAIYFEGASDLYRARFYLWRLHLYTIFGNGIGMVADYLEAKQYAGALDSTRRANLHLDGAYAYREIKEYETARRLVREAKTLFRHPETYEDSVALARALHSGAETQLRLGTRLTQATEDLRASARIYGALGDTAQVAIATTLLGETYAADGDTSAALAEIAKGAQLARRAGSVRSEIYALFRQGRLLREREDFDAAKQSLREALSASETVKEFTFRIRYELARLHEQRREYDRASSYYQTVIDAPKPSNSFAGELEAVQKAREGKNRVLLFKAKRRTRLVLFGSVLGFLLLLGLVGTRFFLHLRRREAILDQLQDATVIPKNLHTGLTLEQLERRFQKVAESELFGSRLAFLFAVLYEPDLVMPYIEDGYLLPQVEENRVADNSALFLCSAAVEEAVKDMKFRGRAENTLRSYLSGEFEKRDWEWPKSPLAWKLFFLEQHARALF